MTPLEFIDRNLKTILFFVGIFGITGGFGTYEAYIESAQFYGWVQSLIAKININLDF